MATWKKVIVSGSAANLASLQVDNLLNGVVTGSANGTLGIQTINGTGNIVATTGATGLVASGSFSGSFRGDGTNLTGVTATPSFPTTVKTDLASTDKFFINDDAGDGTVGNKKITYGNLLTDLAGTNLVTESNDSLTLAANITGLTSINATNFTGSFTGSLTGALTGTASFATSASQAITASYILQAVSASFATSAVNASTASFVTTAQTASYVLNAVSASNANLLDGLDSTAFAVLSSANTFTNNQIISGTLTVAPGGNSELQVLSTGTRFGNIISDTHTMTGSLSVSGSVTATNFTGSILGTASTASFVAGANVSGSVTSASYALTASYAANGGTLLNALTFGTGLSGSASTFNGSAAVTVAISGSATLSTNTVPKWTGTGLANSFISENASQVTIATGSVISAGGLTVTGNSTFNNNVTIAGDLAVNGTTTFINTTNTYIKDQFVLIASGSSTLTDAGIVAQYNAAGSGSAWYLEAGSAGTYGRWAVAYDVIGTSTAVTADEYVVTAKISANSNPSAAPTWGGASNGSGNIWIKNDTGDIFIYA
jgi:hypothetical protein